MEMHDRQITRPSADERAEISLPNDQFIYPNGINAFDPNLCSAAEYSPPPSSSYTSTTDASAITYNNVIFLPTIALNERPADDVETVKNETVAMESSLPYKYVVPSDLRFASTFSRSGEIVENISGINHINDYVESAPHMIAAASNVVCDENLVYHPNDEHHAQYSYIDADFMHHGRDKHIRSDTEIVMQGSNGQLYRHVHNVYVNHADASNSVELIPTLISEAMANGIGYATHEYDHPNENGHTAVTYEMHASIDGTICAADKQQLHLSGSGATIDLIYDNYKEQTQQYTLLKPIEQNNVIRDSGEVKTNYTSKLAMEKDQQRILLESTMSPLLAAVNDITAREEQYQSYLAQNKVEASKNAVELNYYYSSDVNAHDSIQQRAHIDGHALHFIANKSRTMHTSALPSKSIFIGECENTRTSCASPADEYVDINEMEFIEPNGGKDDNLLMRRSHRKKTTKKCEELMVVDKHVPSRAWATLPTSYLFFGNCTNNLSLQVIFAKKDIPLRTKFGPFEGDIKILDDVNLLAYRKSHINLPLLFVSPNSILDISNEKTSNWMRFVYLATKYMDQNLLLYEVDGELFFKSCQFIAPKQQLRVGYSKEYAEKYKLPLLVADEIEKQKLLEKQYPWQCSECSKRFSTADKLHEHSAVHAIPKSLPIVKSTMATPSKSQRTDGEVTTPSSVSKCSNHRLNTGAIRKRKLALSKNSRTSGPTVRYACCYCSKVFSKFVSYKKHTNNVHSMDVDNKRLTLTAAQKCKEIVSGNKFTAQKDVTKKWFVCSTCQRYFATAQRLEKHEILQCIKNDTKSVQCQYCPKRVQTPSALTMHMRTHNTNNGLFQCPFCKERYQNTLLFKEHVKIHMKNGTYLCPHCKKDFAKYSAIRKHMQLNHSTVRYKCQSCPKEFKSRYKLKEHRLCHSDVRQFLCADCGKQFKRKDKLREHILKIHAAKSDPAKMPPSKISSQSSNGIKKENNTGAHLLHVANEQIQKPQKRPAVTIESDVSKSAKFQPKVAPTDYQRFIYKCNDCMLGFKRRGMLVNHMAKQHPNISIDSVPELNLPILQTQRCYYCTYCNKVYKSSSKRKAHILKYHPGRELPQSTRQKNGGSSMNTLGVLHNPSFSESISSVTTHAHRCTWCYKQYASRTRLLQHQRKEHNEEIHCNFKATSNNDYYRTMTHHQMPDNHNYQVPEQEHPSNDKYKLHNYNDQTNHDHHQQYIDFEPENKLLKLSSAALDFQFFDNDECEKDTVTTHAQLSKVDVNFKVVGNEYVDTSTSSNSLPQLFEEIGCIMTVKPTCNGTIDSHANRNADDDAVASKSKY